jgi:hypothetical protein
VTILTLLRSAYWIRIITTTNNSASLAGRRQQQHRRSGRVRGSELNSVGASQARSSRSAVKQGTHRHRTSVTRARPHDAAGRAATRSESRGRPPREEIEEGAEQLARAHTRTLAAVGAYQIPSRRASRPARAAWARALGARCRSPTRSDEAATVPGPAAAVVQAPVAAATVVGAPRALPPPRPRAASSYSPSSSALPRPASIGLESRVRRWWGKGFLYRFFLSGGTRGGVEAQFGGEGTERRIFYVPNLFFTSFFLVVEIILDLILVYNLAKQMLLY